MNGKRHRLDGPAIEYANGGKEWWVNGKCHRLDGPAIEYANGGKEWRVNGKRHRLDGPAVERAHGGKEWWANGIESLHLRLCEKVLQQNLTHEELYPLCTHEDYVVREIAMNHPNCPPAWKVAGKLTNAMRHEGGG